MTRRVDGLFRVLPGRSGEELLLVDTDSTDPIYVPRTSLPGIAVGNLIEAVVVWEGDSPTIESATVETETEFRFRRTDEPIFEAARSCFEAARAAGEAMNSRVTYDTDRTPNGVVYAFADQPGSRDLFAEFRDGTKPLEPLLARAADGAEPPFSVWILDSEEPFVVVYIVLDPSGLLDRTMGDTYGRE